ncbi:MAG: IPT/TIG domain-containing protein, partial [Candidatus Hydrogenedentota bacterium]
CRNWRSVAIENGCRIQIDRPGTTLVRDPDSGGAIFATLPHGLGRIAFLASSSPLEVPALSHPPHRRFVRDLFRWLDDAGREVSDLDGDGLPDSIEDANQNAALDPGETDRFNPDTDGDGIPDGIEDRNRNGRTDEGETSAVNPDSDNDGIWDGADRSPLPPAGTPVVDAVRPVEAPAEGGIWVQVSGRNFAPGMRVRFGERFAERVRVLGPRGLEALLPPAASPKGATVDVVVEGLELDQVGTLPDGFRYRPRSSVSLKLERVGQPGGDPVRLAIEAAAPRSAQVERLTFRLDTRPPRAVEWLNVAPGNDALRNGRQVVSRPDPEGGIWIDISPARTSYPLGSLVVVQCRSAEAPPDDELDFTITRARAFAPNGTPLQVEIGN